MSPKRKEFPHLNRIPGLEQMNVPASDFVPRSRRVLLTWSVVFFVGAAASAVAGWGEVFGVQTGLLFKLFFLLFSALGLITLLGTMVNSPTA